jgi:2-C-methyl-D-erythritol 4-phosphate cytidylyltransferase / 2-C-methyl-D-erythritol 2,4-cyclodiphosphate synthase
MPRPERTAAILVAAGRGLRAGAGGPKQYRELGGQTVIFRAMQAFSRHPDIFAVQPVVNPDDAAIFNEAVAGLRHQPPTSGGATRQASVHAGLEALAAEKPDIVLIHDAARPLCPPLLFDRCLEWLDTKQGACVSLPVTDTLKEAKDGWISRTLDRDQVVAVQTPQAFHTEVYRRAHDQAALDGFEGTDDASLVEHIDVPVWYTLGDPANLKITIPHDLAVAEALLR